MHLPKINDKDMREEVKNLVREGWTVESGGRHIKIKTPCGRLQAAVSTSPGRVHAIDDMRKQIKHIRRRIAEMGPKP